MYLILITPLKFEGISINFYDIINLHPIKLWVYFFKEILFDLRKGVICISFVKTWLQ